MQFQIKNRFSGAIQFEAQIEVKTSASVAVKLGAAVKAAVSSGADLRGADLRGADLRGAYLGGAYLGGADLRGADLGGAYLGGDKIQRLIAYLNRLDGYSFFAFELEAGGLKIQAGCRWFTLGEYRAHIEVDYPGTEKAQETSDILNFIEARAKALKVI